MKKNEIEKYCLDLVTPIVEANNFYIWDVVYEKEGADYYLRVYIDKEEGITIDDCVLVNRALDAKLDEEDKIKDAYILEVSSPGLTRVLKRENDFKHSVGRIVDIKFYKPFSINNEKKKELTGTFKAYDSENFTVRLEGGNEVVIPKQDVSSIKLAYVE